MTVPDYPFKTDGCSGGMTTMWTLATGRPPPWNDLCEAHDLAYHAGGTARQRWQADLELMIGVARNGHPIWAFLMWASVRPGGVPWLPLPWRWGYGSKFFRPYDAPS